MLVTTKPAAPASDLARWEAVALRRRLLEGAMREDYRTATIEQLGLRRSRGIGRVDESSCVLAQLAWQIACAYDEGVDVGHENGTAGEIMRNALEAAGWAELMQTISADLIACQEVAVRVDAVKGADERIELTFRPVYPDYLVGYADPNRPDVPLRLDELRLLDGEWVWESWDIRGEPTFARRRAVDDSEILRLQGEAYPFRYTGEARAEALDGQPVAPRRPFLPYVLYHARRSYKLWNEERNRALVQGTIQAALYWTLFGHALKWASWPQRYVVDGEVSGADAEPGADGEAERRLVVDPTLVAEIRTLPDEAGGGGGRQAMPGQWTTGADIGTLYDAATRYEQRVARIGGVAGSDFERQEGDPRSAYALAITDAARVRLARKSVPSLRSGDTEMIGKVAAVLNISIGSRLPEQGWTIGYNAIPEIHADAGRDPADPNAASAGADPSNTTGAPGSAPIPGNANP